MGRPLSQVEEIFKRPTILKLIHDTKIKCSNRLSFIILMQGQPLKIVIFQGFIRMFLESNIPLLVFKQLNWKNSNIKAMILYLNLECNYMRA